MGDHLDVAALRADTPGCAHTVHFNNAGSGLMPGAVVTAMVDHLRLEARVGGYEAAAARPDDVHAFYTETAALINGDPDGIAFFGSATQAYATALSSIPFQAGDVILTTRNDYVSNQIAFLSLARRFGVRLVHAPDAPEGGADVAAMADLMRSHRPRLVAVTHMPTNSGLVQPVAEIGRVARELDLLYLVDACQSVGQYPVDVASIGCDLLTATCRKFLRGPRGSGFLHVSDRVLAAGYEPLFPDVRGATWTGPQSYEPQATAVRFEDWESAYAVVLGCAAAARYARRVGMPAIWRRSSALAARLRERLSAIPGGRVLDRGPSLSAIVMFALDGVAAETVKAALAGQGINSHVSSRNVEVFDLGDRDVGWALRLSPHYYNTEEEVDRVAAAIAEVGAEG
jgi:selenocysteine lyase/cysteine desulfurase